MKKYFRIRSVLLTLAMLTFFGNWAYSQCTLTLSANKVCRGTSVQFSIPTSTTFTTIKWAFGDGDSSNQPTNTVNHIYNTPGVYTASVTLYNSDGSIKCGPSIAIITVYDNPNADLILPPQTIMCFENNHFCFTQKATPGTSNAPISSYLWDFGSGDSSTIPNPCYSYKNSGKYTIYLRVTDTNGCWDSASKISEIVVLPKLNPNFSTQFIIGCPETPVTFRNLTDTAGKDIVSWIWDFGDGTRDSTDTVWGVPPFKKIYKKDGTFNPTLIIKSGFGCVDSIKKFSGAQNIFYYFDIKKSESGPICWEGNNLCFGQKPRPKAYYWLWEFDDPPSMLLNFNDQDWEPCHAYTAPGFYHISLKIWEPNCIRDTTFCTYIPLKGPMAAINMPPPPAFPPNNQVQSKPIPLSAWHAASTRCWNPNLDPIDYVSRDPVPPFPVGTRSSYCNMPLDSANFDTTFKPWPCPLGNPFSVATSMGFPLLGTPTTTVTLYDSVVETPGTWWPGSALPPGITSGTVYFPKTGSVNYKTMHDTDIYPPKCTTPNYVRFTNNSYKYRMYYAIDDDPLKYHPYPVKQKEIKFDECYNPSYPWGSDSMLYWWNFGDGDVCTSTVAKPNMNCMFSNEPAPWHLFKDEGCNQVTLTVTDTVTNCVSEAQQLIYNEPPRAGWDTTNYGIMQRLLNTVIPERIADPTLRRFNGMWDGEYPFIDYYNQLLKPRNFNPITQTMIRGVRLDGIPCVGANYDQVPSFGETKPCGDGGQMWWMVFDSLGLGFGGCRVIQNLDTFTRFCGTVKPYVVNGKTYYDKIYPDTTILMVDGVPDTAYHLKPTSCGWVDKITFMMMGNKWNYQEGGWKTLGVIIKTGDCFDTFWYHNYKYVFDLDARFKLHDDTLNAQTGRYPELPWTNSSYQKYYTRLCEDQQSVMTLFNQKQVGITKHYLGITRAFPPASPQWPAIDMLDSCKKTVDTFWTKFGNTYLIDTIIQRDTVYRFCHKDSFTVDPFTGKKDYFYCMYYPDITRNRRAKKTEMDEFYNLGFRAIDTFPQLTLTDTLFHKQDGAPWNKDIEKDWSMNGPGIYNATSMIRNIYNCVGSASARIVVGHYADYEADKRIICYEGGGDTVVFKHTVRYFWLRRAGVWTDTDLNPNQYWVDPYNSLGLYDPDPAFGLRNGPPAPPAIREKVEWDFGDGSGWVTNKYLVDTISWIYNVPQDYTIKMRTIDSNGCVQVLERKNYIKVMGIVADFDTATGVGVCAPQQIKFLDKSFGLNTWKYIYDGQGKIIDSTEVDSATHWYWTFGDSLGTSSFSYVQDPIHTYTRNGNYDVRLIVKMAVGCVDTLEIPKYINIEGPKPKFWIWKNGQKSYSDTICKGEYIVVLDSSDATEVWQFVKGDATTFSDSLRPANNQWAIQYTKPGVYKLHLSASAKVFFPLPAPGKWDYCTDVYGNPAVHAEDSAYTVVVYDIPEAKFDGDTLICDGDVAEFNELSDTSYTQVVWYYGDNTGYETHPQGQAVTHQYTTGSSYDTVYTVEIQGQGVHCPDKIKKMDVRVMKTVADLEIKEDRMPEYIFSNLSKGVATNYKWTVTGVADDGHVFNEEVQMKGKDPFSFDFGNYKGDFTVCLWSWIDGLGCMDSTCIIVPNTFEVKLEIPNIFTPGNLDGVNDQFTITHKGVEFWELTIFNRWGEKMFETTDEENHWDGTNMKNGQPAAGGTYYFVLNAQLRGEELKSYSGTVTLVR